MHRELLSVSNAYFDKLPDRLISLEVTQLKASMLNFEYELAQM
jgi:hypothetical protein